MAALGEGGAALTLGCGALRQGGPPLIEGACALGEGGVALAEGGSPPLSGLPALNQGEAALGVLISLFFIVFRLRFVCSESRVLP